MRTEYTTLEEVQEYLKNENDDPIELYDLKFDKQFQVVAEDITGYYDGNVQTEYVFEHISTKTYWATYETSNSWDEYDDGEKLKFTQVYPQEKTIIVYV